MKNIILLLLLFVFTNNLSAQWEGYEVGFATALDIWDMDAVNENVAWAITTDGVYSGNVWQISLSSTFTTTSDGGATWTIGDLPFPNDNWGLWKISAVDANTAWVIASNPFTLGAAVYKTTDGGLNWTQQIGFTDQSFASVIHFWDENEGIVVGDPVAGEFEIHTTSDGGENWVQIESDNIPDPTSVAEFVSTSVCNVVGDNIWFGTRFGRVYHSADRGLNWSVGETHIAANTDNTWIEGIAFSDGLKGIAHSANYGLPPYNALIAYTEDGGLTWTEQVLDNDEFSIFNAQYIPGTEMLVKTSRASNGSGPFATSVSLDHGVSWTDIETGTPIHDFDFIDASSAWGGKFKNDNDPTEMYKYTGNEITSLFAPKPLQVDLSIHPSLVTSYTQLTIQSNETTELDLKIFSSDGQLVASLELGEGKSFSERIDLDRYPSGVYTLMVRDEKGSIRSEQFVKQ